MKINQKVNVHNEFKIEVRDKDTGKLKNEAKAYNIVLNSYFERLVNRNSHFVGISIGRGTGVLSPIRTTLFNHITYKSGALESSIREFPISSVTRKIIFMPEEIVGETITEVGVAFASSTTSLLTHAMLEDSEGNPISITKTDTDVVTIYATVYFVFTEGLFGGKGVWAPTHYSTASRNNALLRYFMGDSTALWVGVSAYQGETPTVHEGDGLLGNTPTANTAATIANSVQRTIRVTARRFDINTANGPIKSLGITTSNGPIFLVPLPATGVFEKHKIVNEQVGSGDGLKREFNLKWNGAIFGSQVVKVDGVPTSALEFVPKKRELGAPKLSDERIGEQWAANVSFEVTPFVTKDNKYLLTGSSNNSYKNMIFEVLEHGFIRHIMDNNSSGLMGSTVKNAFVKGYAQDEDTLIMMVSRWNFAPSFWIQRVNLKTREVTTVQSINFIKTSAKLTQDERFLITTHTSSTSIVIYAVNLNSENAVLTTHSSFTTGLSGSLSRVDLTNDEKFILVQSSNGIVRVYNFNAETASVGSQVGSDYNFSGSIGSTQNESLILSKNNDIVATHSGTIGKFDKITGLITLTETLTPVDQTVYSLDISPDGTLIAYGSFGSNGGLLLFHLNSETGVRGELIARVPGTCNTVKFFEDSSGQLYLRATGPNGTGPAHYEILGTKHNYNIKFETPPPEGAAITVDYEVPYIPKDSNHVLDVEVTLQFGEG